MTGAADDRVLDPTSPLGQFYTSALGRVGQTITRSLGTLDEVTIQRYALTIGATDSRHTDPAAARGDGHHGVVAPPNLLAAIFEWGAGTPESQLNPDGTPPRETSDLRLRGMGVGEEMEIVRPVVAGTRLELDETVHAVKAAQTRSGPCVFLTTEHVFRDADGDVLNRNLRTVALQDPVAPTEESR